MRQSKIYWKYISKQNEGVTGQFKGQQQFLWKKKKHWWPSLGLIMDGLWRTVGQSAGQKSCVKFQNKKSAQAAIAEDRRRAKSPDVLAHRLSHLHNSHQGVGLGFGKHFLSIDLPFPESKAACVKIYGYGVWVWCNVVMLGCRGLSFYCAGLSFYYKTLPLHVKCVSFFQTAYKCLHCCLYSGMGLVPQIGLFTVSEGRLSAPLSSDKSQQAILTIAKTNWILSMSEFDIMSYLKNSWLCYYTLIWEGNSFENIAKGTTGLRVEFCLPK